MATGVTLSRRAVPALSILLGLAIVALNGCGAGGEGRRTVTGKVTYQGTPVGEGTITFEDQAAGFANQATLGSDGAYSLEVPDGTFAVSIQPPMVEISSGPESPPDEVTKDMQEIPKRYRQAETSGLSATVAKGQTTHDFDMSS